MARRFMFVCFGILALAITYHVGAMRVQAATGGTIDCALPYYCGGNCTAAVIGRTIYHNGLPASVPVPETGRVIAMGTVSNGDVAIVLDNGDAYSIGSDFRSWTPLGNVVGGVTPATIGSFGALKTHYR